MGVISIVIGIITQLITGGAPPCGNPHMVLTTVTRATCLGLRWSTRKFLRRCSHDHWSFKRHYMGIICIYVINIYLYIYININTLCFNYVYCIYIYILYHTIYIYIHITYIHTNIQIYMCIYIYIIVSMDKLYNKTSSAFGPMNQLTTGRNCQHGIWNSDRKPVWGRLEIVMIYVYLLYLYWYWMSHIWFIGFYLIHRVSSSIFDICHDLCPSSMFHLFSMAVQAWWSPCHRQNRSWAGWPMWPTLDSSFHGSRTSKIFQ